MGIGTLISIGYDNVLPSSYPNSWNMKLLFIVSSSLGLIAMTSSLFLLWCCLDSWEDDSVFAYLGIGGVSYGHITAIIYLKVSVSDFLTLFSARTGDKWFCAIAPAPILLFAGFLAIGLSTSLAYFWPEGMLDSVPIEGLGSHGDQHLIVWVWGYCIAVWLIQDFVKVSVHAILKGCGMTTVVDYVSPAPNDKDLKNVAVQ